MEYEANIIIDCTSFVDVVDVVAYVAIVVVVVAAYPTIVAVHISIVAVAIVDEIDHTVVVVDYISCCLSCCYLC